MPPGRERRYLRGISRIRRSSLLAFVALLGLALVVSPATATAAVLRVTDRAVVRSCAYARAHGNATEHRRCLRLLRHGVGERPAPAAPAAASTYQNPVSGVSPDPAGLNNNGTGSDYYLYTTGSLFPIQHSTDLVHWTSVGTALAVKPSWVVQSGNWDPWSPTVLEASRACPGTTSPSCYYMYYVGLSAQFSTNCVAVATSTTPGGPFTDRGPLSNGVLDSSGRPIGCGDDSGYGDIDPAPFVDTDGKAYLYVSTDRSCPAGSTSCTSSNSTLTPTISVMALGPSLLRASGRRRALFSGDQPWEAAPWAMVVEGPWVEKHFGRYYLFYSGGPWTGNYAMGFAVLSSPLGPATKNPGNPILAGNGTVFGPGGGSTIRGPRGEEWMLYHARLGGYTQPRQLFIDRVVWHTDGTVTVRGPTTTPQSPAP